MDRHKLAQLLRTPAMRKLIVSLVVALVATTGFVLDPSLADDLVIVAATVADTM